MPEIQDIFAEHGDAYHRNHPISFAQSKAMIDIERCRTAALGAHVDICDNCSNTEISYNSCRNRHCPKCQTLPKERWIDNRKHDLLNIGYFHVVFTVPSELRSVFYQNQNTLYNLLFKATAETLQVLASNKKYLGAKLGFTSILHTWAQNLCYHPHIHCIVPGGGLDDLGGWKESRKKFFIPVRVLSRLFRGKFMHYLKEAELQFYGKLKIMKDADTWNRLIDLCYRKEWVVYCKPPFKDAACVVEYLGRYTHRVAISNNRIVNIDNGQVSFKWRDYDDRNRWKTMSLPTVEFIRRFLMHILPPRFMKIRHYGLLANRDKSTRLELCKRLTCTPVILRQAFTAAELILRLTGLDITKCSVCGHDKHHCYMGHAPPVPA